MMTLLYAKCMGKQPQTCLDAASLLQVQYTRTPHYASALLYAYGRTIIDSKLTLMLPNAISAL